MKRFLIVAAMLALGGVAQAGPIRNAVKAMSENIAERRASRQVQPKPVQDFIQAKPVRTVLANGFEATGQVIQQAGGIVRPTCSNGQCPR